MRMVLIGQAAFGAKVLENLLEKGEEVVAVYTLPDGRRMDPIKETALAQGIPVFQPANYRDDQVFEQYQALAPELTVMAFVTPIIPERFFSFPTHGAINYHPSLLPRHRGASAINWALIMGDDKTGLSIFRPDGGIDTGPILLQKEIPIQDTDTTGSIYFNHLFPMGVEAIMEALELVKSGTAPEIEQDESLATYEPICDDRVAGIDWTRPGPETYNLIRGCDPQPGAFAVFRGEKVRLYGPGFDPTETGQAPGTIVACEDQGIRVAVHGGTIAIAKLRNAAGKMAAAEFVQHNRVKAGDRFA